MDPSARSMHLMLQTTWVSVCNLRDSARRRVERDHIWQIIMVVPQGSVEDVREVRTIGQLLRCRENS